MIHSTQRLALAAGTAIALAMPTAPFAQNVTEEVPARIERPVSFAQLAETISPSVVNITTTTGVERPADDMLPQVPEGSPFEDFFREFQDRQGPNGPRRGNALGSGFVISPDGYIVTNNHVIQGADEIMIEFYPGGGDDVLEAEIVGTDPNTDLAVLKVEPEGDLDFVDWGPSEDSRVGDWVLAMGNPLGQGFSVSAGIVSAQGRALRGVYDDYIQTDAAINRGNSGGPLFNMDGEVVGVNTAILSPTGGSIGIGFAMSSAVAEDVVDQLIEFGETRRGWLGVRIQNVDDDLVEALGLDDAQGVLVTDVPEGPSAEAGIESGDVILSFDGQPVTDVTELVRVVAGAAVGSEVDVTVFRDGEELTLPVTLARREDAEDEAVPVAAENDGAGPATTEAFGMTVSEIDDGLREAIGLGDDVEGLVVVEADDDGEAFEKGLRRGDLVIEVGQEPVDTVDAFDAQVQAARDAGRRSVLMLVRREGEPRFVALNLE
ncbi:serine protease Do [Hasllibacter halocynthiae]|uniref:Serine protease Do n=1 Tax=Hasllibacter halocynthiae TaxID=595589 RepID=A0A2T0X702_9RHOB|nr:serine protease Do [Hasllibacter halocynthiae]